MKLPDKVLKKLVYGFSMVDEKWHFDLIRFIFQGRAGKRFKKHLDECARCQALVDQILKYEFECLVDIHSPLVQMR